MSVPLQLSSLSTHITHYTRPHAIKIKNIRVHIVFKFIRYSRVVLTGDMNHRFDHTTDDCISTGDVASRHFTLNVRIFVCVNGQNEVLSSMRSDIRWIRNRVSSLVDNLTDQHHDAVNTSPAAAAQGLYDQVSSVTK